VNYKGTGAAIIGVMAGETQLMIGSAAGTAPHLKAGKLTGLAVTTLQPTALAPGLPTLSASGLPGYECVSFDAMWAPAGTPAAIITRLNREIAHALNTTEVKDKLFSIGSDSGGGTPEEFGRKIKSEMAKWRKVIKDTGMQTQ
jgi:tripartite-type tricarboxylate transporter receptor subunit TctC